MRASMTADESGGCYSGLQCIWGDPRGLTGVLALAMMAAGNVRQNKAALDLLAPKVGDSVIELGCGPGMGVRAALKRVGKTGYVAGVDQSATASHCASHAAHTAVRSGQAVIMRAEAANLPFRDSMFDRAFVVNSLQFWGDPARALREIARVLAPGGRLVITQRASSFETPSNIAGAARGMERIGQATAILKAQGWRIVDERGTRDGSRFLAVSVLAERPL